ncbi:MAG: thioesterase family protein [Mycobacterium sp.]
MPAEPYVMPLRVRYVECDMQGRVFNGHYLTWVDMAHTEAIGAILGGYQGLVAGGVDLVVAAAELQFRQPARFDDDLTVLVTLKPPGNTSLQSTFSIVRDDTVLAECLMTHVCVDTETYSKQPWPDWIRERLNSASVLR